MDKLDRESTRRPSTLTRAYLLRCWREPAGAGRGAFVWRFSVEIIGAGERLKLGFVDLDGLIGFLRAELNASPNGEGGEIGHEGVHIVSHRFF